MNKNKNVLFGILAILILAYLIWQGYKQNWTGFNITPNYSGYRPGKYLWDWLEIIIVPLVLTLIGVYFNARQKKVEIENATETEKRRTIQNQIKEQESELSRYFEKINDLILRDGLAKESASLEVKSIARSMTTEIFQRISIEYAPKVINYLYENHLIGKENCKVNLSGVALARIDLSERNLNNVNLSGIKIYAGNLSGTDFSNSNLSDAVLFECNLRNSKFTNTDITATDLKNCNLVLADFRNAQGSRADFSYTHMYETVFENANLHKSEYFQSRMIQVNFQKANLSGAIFSQATIWDCFMKETNLQDTNISFAYISGSAPLQDNWTPSKSESRSMDKNKGLRSFIQSIFLKKKKEKLPF